MIKEHYNTQKVRITSNEIEGQMIFRLEVKWNNRTMHANVSTLEALDISEAIYQAIPEELAEELFNRIESNKAN